MIPLRDTIPSRHAPVMTVLLIAVNLVVFVYELTLERAQVETLFYLLGVVPARITSPSWAAATGFPPGSWLTLLTSMFLHGGWLHVVGNVWTLWIFGDNVEDRMGPFRFLTFYVLCGLAAGGAHLVTNPGSTLPTVGASGAIAGVMGAYFLLFPHSRVVALVPVFFYPLFFEVPAFLFLAYWFLVQVFSGTMALGDPTQMGGVAWWAHGGGFVAGAVLQGLFLRRRKRAPVERHQP